MLDHLRQRVAETLAQTHTATLATFGPAKLQANVFPCEGAEDELYILVPRTSDHLLNIENNPAVVVTTENWHLQGTAEVVARCPAGLALREASDAPWCQMVRIAPTRLHIMPADARAFSETIDVF